MARTTIPAELVAVNAIQGTLIADNSVTAVHIATNAISGTLVADNAVTSTHIAQNQVTATQIAQNTITVTQMADDAIETAKINASAVTTAKINNGAVTDDKLAANSVTSAKIVNGTIVAADLADNAVTIAKMASLARGKIIYGDSAGDPAALALGSAGTFLISDGTDISWGSTLSGNLAITKEDPNITLTDSSASRTLSTFVDNNNSVIRSSGQMLIQIGSESAITILSNKDICIGNTVVNPASGFASQKGFGYDFSHGTVEIAVDSDTTSLVLGRNHGNNGVMQTFRKQSTSFATIGIEGGDSLYIQAGTTSGSGILMHGSGAKVLPARQGTSIDATIDLGQASRKWKDIHLSSNVLFGGNLHFNAATDSSYIGPASTSNIQYAADGLHRFQTYNGAWTTIYDIADTGIYQSEGNFAYHSLVPFFGTSVGSYSSSTNIDWADTGSESIPDRGEKLVAMANVRAYTNYVHFKTNLTANNIMFYFRTRGYQYGSGMEEHVYGGYTYTNNSVITVEHQTVYGGTHTLAAYRDSSGYLVLRMHANQTGYTEGRQYIFFSSHSNQVTRELQITAVKQRDDGNNAF